MRQAAGWRLRFDTACKIEARLFYRLVGVAEQRARLNFPKADLGPVLRLALARLAAICFSVAVADLLGRNNFKAAQWYRRSTAVWPFSAFLCRRLRVRIQVAPLSLQEVLQVTVVPSMQVLHTSRH